MSYRKFRADQLFTGDRLLPNSHVLITNEEGVIESIVPSPDAGGDVLELKGILSPGFINCHCHLELSHLKGTIRKNTGMTDFILNVVNERHHAKEIIVSAIEAAENEMLQNGIVATGDICNTDFTLAQKKKGRMHYHNFIEVSGFSPSIAGDRFATSVAFFNAFAQQYALPVESNSIVPHAPYSVSPELFQTITNFPGNHILTMHSQESLAEEHLFKDKRGDFLRLYEQMNIDLSFFNASGKTSLQTVLPYFKKNQTLILVHNVTTSEKDINNLSASSFLLPAPGSRLPAHHLYFCVCPNANLYIGNGLPDIDLLMSSGYPIVLGTDSLASNHQLSILNEIRTVQKQFPHIELTQLLQWATINGAKALQLDEMLGSFEKGKRPRVLLIHGATETILENNSSVERLL